MSFRLNPLMVIAGLVVGNFLWQAIHGHDWHVAYDRSWFQAVAILVMHLTDKFLPRKEP